MTTTALLRLAAGRMRAALLRLRGASVGSKVTLGFLNRYDNPSRMSIGCRTTTESHVWIKIESTNARVDVGDFCFLGRNTEIDCITSVVIGDRTLIAPNVFITDHNHIIEGRGRISEQACTSESVQIGNDVWIGAGAAILPGVSIGDGAVVGAGAVVTRSIPAFEIWAGVPARCLRVRKPK